MLRDEIDFPPLGAPMKKRHAKKLKAITKKSDKKAIAKLTKNYRKYFAAPQENPETFQIFTLYDYGSPAQLTNHT